jgi:hypothetical protein
MTTAITPPPLPDHLSTDARSPHYSAAVFEHDIGIRFNDKERVDVAEYCISEGGPCPRQNGRPQRPPLDDQTQGQS